MNLLLFPNENRKCLKITMNKTIFVPSKLLRQIYSGLLFFWISFLELYFRLLLTRFYRHLPCVPQAEIFFFFFIYCVVGIYASGMHRDPRRPSYGQKWIERGWGAAGYFTNMWPENTPRAQPSPYGLLLCCSLFYFRIFSVLRFLHFAPLSGTNWWFLK